jgi:hypothetical protein
MFLRMRVKSFRSMFRRLVVATAASAAMSCLSVPSIYAQSGMCAAGSGTTAGTGATGTTGGVSTSRTTTGSSVGRSTGTAGTATQALGMVQMAHQFQMMVARQEQAQALEVMQAMYVEAEMIRLNQLQIEQHRAARLAQAQKRRALQAAKAQQRKKNGAPNSRKETLVSEKPVTKASKRM